MYVYQCGRTTNSVTINVSGITDGDRRTSVWIPAKVLGENEGAYYTLQNAKNLGYISDFSTVSIDGVANGDITITMTDEYLDLGFRCVDWYVENINTSSYDSWIYITTVLEFKYEHSEVKYSGDDIDITVRDMKELNLFGGSIESWIAGGEGYYYNLDGFVSGDPIYADFLWLPANNIVNAINYAISEFITSAMTGAYGALVNDRIVQYCVSGADFKAQYFNLIADAINNFNISIEV